MNEVDDQGRRHGIAWHDKAEIIMGSDFSFISLKVMKTHSHVCYRIGRALVIMQKVNFPPTRTCYC